MPLYTFMCPSADLQMEESLLLPLLGINLLNIFSSVDNLENSFVILL